MSSLWPENKRLSLTQTIHLKGEFASNDDGFKCHFNGEIIAIQKLPKSLENHDFIELSIRLIKLTCVDLIEDEPLHLSFFFNFSLIQTTFFFLEYSYPFNSRQDNI